LGIYSSPNKGSARGGGFAGKPGRGATGGYGGYDSGTQAPAYRDKERQPIEPNYQPNYPAWQPPTGGGYGGFQYPGYAPSGPMYSGPYGPNQMYPSQWGLGGFMPSYENVNNPWGVQPNYGGNTGTPPIYGGQYGGYGGFQYPEYTAGGTPIDTGGSGSARARSQGLETWGGMYYRNEFGRLFPIHTPGWQMAGHGLITGELPPVIKASWIPELTKGGHWLSEFTEDDFADMGYIKVDNGDWMFPDPNQTPPGGGKGGGGYGGGGGGGKGGGGKGGGGEEEGAQQGSTWRRPTQTTTGRQMMPGYTNTGRYLDNVNLGLVNWRI